VTTCAVLVAIETSIKGKEQQNWICFLWTQVSFFHTFSWLLFLFI